MTTIIKALIFVLIFCFFLCIATYIQNLYFIPKIDYEVKLIDLMNVIATVCIGLAIPLYISKFIDDKKTSKVLLVDECKKTLDEVSRLRSLILSIPNGNIVSSLQQDEIMLILELSEKQLDNLICFLNEAKLSPKIYNPTSFKQSFLDYWDAVTGGSLMSSNFAMTGVFKSSTSLAYLDLEKEIKLFISKLHLS